MPCQPSAEAEYRVACPEGVPAGTPYPTSYYSGCHGMPALEREAVDTARRHILGGGDAVNTLYAVHGPFDKDEHRDAFVLYFERGGRRESQGFLTGLPD